MRVNFRCGYRCEERLRSRFAANMAILGIGILENWVQNERVIFIDIVS